MNPLAGIAVAASLLGGVPEDETKRAHARLAEAGVPLETDALLGVLRRRILSPEDMQRVSAAVLGLASDSFRQRESATNALIRLGLKASAAVEAALAGATDLEIRSRLEHVAQRIHGQRDDALLWSAIVELRRVHPAEAVEPLLQLLPQLSSRRLRAPAQEALWASVDNRHLTLLRNMLRGELAQQAAALVALEKLTADPQLALSRREHPSPIMQLATARALSAHRPRLAAVLLVQLLEHSDRAIQAESRYLLRLFYLASENRDPPERPAADYWPAWIRQRGPELAKLDGRRHRCGVLRLGIHEDFAVNAPSAAAGYGPFVYQSTVPSKVAVRDGRLYLDGGHGEGDQRLAISAESLVSAPVLTAPLTVESRIGGLPGNEVGWHVGVSVGNVKALFHPGYRGGAFRIETVDQHQYIMPNQTMPFTPASGVLHTMRLQVTPRNDGGAKFQVLVKDGNSGKTFEASVVATKQQLGPLNRVGLERSGRTGGAAMFDDLEITLQP